MFSLHLVWCLKSSEQAVLAAERRNVYKHFPNRIASLQRSEMCPSSTEVSLLRSEEEPLELPFYKHYVPTGRKTTTNLLTAN
jgi:hypothetical protein